MQEKLGPDLSPASLAADPALARLRLDLGYDGTDFAGWASQPGQRTVAATLRGALERIFGTVYTLTVAGRTDAGVHATAQVCHVDVSLQRWEPVRETVCRRLAGLLPADIRVWSVSQAPSSFDARFSALWRRYEYRISDAEFGAPPLRHRDTVSWPRPLDLSRLTQASTGLLGRHDFAAFCRRKEFATTIRTLTELSWRREADGIVVAGVSADAFCQAMVRSLVGALLAVADGGRGLDWPASLLSRTARADEVQVAPAHGLTLVAVGYPADSSHFGTRADQSRRRRTAED